MKRITWIIVLLCIPALLTAATINVPADQPTIMNAINAAAGGDVVLVAPGTYVENIDFKGKAITVTSSGGPLVTTIDGSGSVNPDYRSTVTFVNGETVDSVLEGFTITGGEGNFGTFSTWNGGGIYLDSADPTIRYNIITGNHVTEAGGTGGGIHLWYCGAGNISGNVIMGNSAPIAGGGVYLAGGSTDIVFENNQIIGNRVNDIDGYGGGFYAFYVGGLNALSLKNTLIADNSVDGFGGGMYVGYGITRLDNCTVINNRAVNGGGFSCGGTGDLTITNTILWNNAADTGKEGYVSSSATNVDMNYNDVEGGRASCVVEGGAPLINWGPDNIDADPEFVTGPEGFHYLSQTAAGQATDSPCVGAGSTLASNLGLDTLWTRTDEVADSGQVDMGYHYGDCAVAALLANVGAIPYTAGGTVDFLVSAGADNAGRIYIIVGGVTGSDPGTALPGGLVTLPVNIDVFTNYFVFPFLNSALFANFMGTLDSDGKASAQLNAPAMPASALGITMTYAYCCNKPYDFVSNPVDIEIID